MRFANLSRVAQLAAICAAALAALAPTATADTLELTPVAKQFVDTRIGATSEPAFFQLTLTCNEPLFGPPHCSGFGGFARFSPSISTIGSYSQINTCRSVMSASTTTSCEISVTFSPTATGLNAGTLKVAGTGTVDPNNAQTVRTSALNGFGAPRKKCKKAGHKKSRAAARKKCKKRGK
jgi:hypothetical protein